MLKNKLENLYTDFQNDSLTRKKYLFYIGSGISMVILLSMMFWLSSVSEEEETKKVDNEVTISNSSEHTSSQLLPVELYHFQDRIKVSSSGVIGLTKNGKFLFNSLKENSGLEDYTGIKGKTITTVHALKADNSAIINTSDQSVYLFKNEELKKYPKNILSISLVNVDKPEDGYYLIREIQNGYSLELSTNIELSDLPSVLATFDNLGNFSQVVSIKNKPYIFSWQGSGMQISTVSSNDSKIQSVHYIKNLQSSYLEGSKFLYNTAIKKKNFFGLIDFTKNISGKQINLNIQNKAEELELKGYVFAKRCVFSEEYTINCLVKKNDSSIYTATEEDKIVKYNYITDVAEIDLPNIGGFAAHDIYIDENDETYILEASSSTIWNLKE